MIGPASSWLSFSRQFSYFFGDLAPLPPVGGMALMVVPLGT
jgi:hypothetical protein